MSDPLSNGKGGLIFNGAYRLERKIGSGSFGTIYLGVNTKTNEVIPFNLSHSFS